MSEFEEFGQVMSETIALMNEIGYVYFARCRGDLTTPPGWAWTKTMTLPDVTQLYRETTAVLNETMGQHSLDEIREIQHRAKSKIREWHTLAKMSSAFARKSHERK